MNAASASQEVSTKPFAKHRWGATAALMLGLALLACGRDKSKGTAATEPTGGSLAAAGTDFEGEITATFTAQGTGSQRRFPTQMVFTLKKPKYRVDTIGASPTGSPQPAGSLIFDVPSKKGILMTPEQKLAMTVSLESLKASASRATSGGPTEGAAPPKVEKTGKKDVVAGYSCEVWNVSHDGKKSEACVAEGASWLDLPSFGAPSPSVALAALANEANRFPLRAISYDAKGAEETRMEVVKVDKKKVEDAAFVPPSDYRMVDMAQLSGGTGAPPGGE